MIASIDRPDNGIWEIRGEPQWFTHSRVMMWAALDRGVRAVREHGLPGDADRWAAVRDGLRREIDERGVDAEQGYFVQHYGSTEVDASLLVLPQVGLLRRRTTRGCSGPSSRSSAPCSPTDSCGATARSPGSTGSPGASIPSSPAASGSSSSTRRAGAVDDARDLMERLIAMSNDLGLLSEEYDVEHARQAGNTPQALSHLSLIRAADALAGHGGRAAHRR